ncbi:MAG: ribonuclease P protein component 4 [Nitrosarchaeum sp.]
MKPSLRKIALERMEILINSAISNARTNPDLSQRQASLAQRISTRHKIRMPYELKIVFCKKCKSFIAPGINSRIRLGRTSVKSIRISCNLCGHTYRKIIPLSNQTKN